MKKHIYILVLILLLPLAGCNVPTEKNSTLTPSEIITTSTIYKNDLNQQLYELSKKTYIDNGIYSGYNLGRLSSKIDYYNSVWLALTEKNLNVITQKDEKAFKELIDLKTVNSQEEELLYNYLLYSELLKSYEK